MTGTIHAQVEGSVRGRTPSPAQMKQKPVTPIGESPLKTSIWQSNFTNAADWIIGNSAGNNANWTISDQPAFWWSGSATLASTSGGYMAAFNSDSYATGPQQVANNAWIQIADTLDCTQFQTVGVFFEQYFNKWTGRTFVEVSNDGGNTWTDFELNAGMDDNDATTNPSSATVNISSVAAGHDDVVVRLLYLSYAISDGGTDNLGGAGWDYGWIVDDVQIGTLPDNDIGIIKGWHADIVNAYEYSIVPVNQACEMVPGVILENQGGLSQTINVICTISDVSGVVSTTEEIVTLGYGAIDTVWFTTGFTPSTSGDYYTSFSIPTDEDPSDDQYEASMLTLDDRWMAHDYGRTSTYGWNPGSSDPDIVAFANAEHSWGNIYYPLVDQNIFAVDVNIAQGTSVGLLLYARVLKIDPINGIQGNLTYNNQQLYEVQASDIGPGITSIGFLSPSTLLAGEGYIIDVLKIDSTSGAGLFIGGSEETTEDDDYSTVAYGAYGDNHEVNFWVGWGFSPYIRANFDQNLSVQSNALDGILVYPNPSEGIVTIENDESTSSLVEVFTIRGEKVLTKEINTTAAIDLTGNGTGIYLVKVSNENGSTVERVVIH